MNVIIHLFYFVYTIVKVIILEKINLIFPGLGYSNINQALIYIYDNDGNLLHETNTYNGRISICLKEKRIYKIKAVSQYERLNNVIYINNNENYILPFSSSYVCSNVNNDNTITFLLTDLNYANLPIEKGTIILWQEM